MSGKRKYLQRIASSGYEPQVGDLFEGGSGVTLAIVHVGRRVEERDDHVAVFKYAKGRWSDYDRAPLHRFCDGVYTDQNGTARVIKDIDFIGSIFAGFGPTGRPHVLFKRAAGVVYVAGCRRFTSFAAAARHWNGRTNRSSQSVPAKRLMAEAAFNKARSRGWLKVRRQPPVKKKVSLKRRDR